MAITRTRPVGAVEIASSAIARIAPRSWAPRIDRVRHDVRALVDGLTGVREPSFTDASTRRVVPAPLRAIDPIAHVLPGAALRHRWVTLRTDVAWIVRDLRGERRPTLVARGPSRHRVASSDMQSAARTLRVVRVVRETDRAVSLELATLDGTPLRFEAGQFLTLHLVADGELVRRAYSISSSPLDGPTLSVTVKRLEGGRGSELVHASVREGDRITVLGPSGSFVAPEAREPAHLVMIAGGSGITPVISITETVMRSRPELRITLVYGNGTRSDAVFADRIERLRAEHASRLHVDHVLADPPEGFTGTRGILDRATLDARLDALPADGLARLYYVCGPRPMMEAARAALTARGVDPDRIREERFHSPGEASRDALPKGPVAVRMKVRGHDHLVRVEPGQTLLEAGHAAGVALPFSCAMGGCGACKVRLVSGAVVSDEDGCLSSRERAEGMVLTCCSRPTGPVAIEVVR